MNHDKAFSLVAEICPQEIGRLWNTTDRTGCDTSWAVADQYADDEEMEARAALEMLASGVVPSDWEAAGSVVR